MIEYTLFVAVNCNSQLASLFVSDVLPWKPKSKIGGTAAAFKRALDDGRFKGLPGSKTKKEKTADMFKIMWAQKKKGAKPHYKPGTDKKYKKYQEEETTYKQRDKELKKTSAARNQRYKDLHKKTGTGNVDINERISYQDFITRLKR